LTKNKEEEEEEEEKGMERDKENWRGIFHYH
jgi:hypothetical protein